jgi:hypothetical protein
LLEISDLLDRLQEAQELNLQLKTR